MNDQLRRAFDVDYWRALARDLHVVEPRCPLAPGSAARAEVDNAVASLKEDGFFRAKGVFARTDIDRLNRGLETLEREGWPAAFAFVFDEFWECARIPSLVQIVTSGLGPGCRQIPHVWVHEVRPVAGAAGWPPHLDGTHGGRLTAWVALTDATLENGCMHVIHRSGAPDRFDERVRTNQTFSSQELRTLLHATRPLPATAGTVLGWEFDIVHWGARVHQPTGVRRSLSLEFIAASEQPGPDEQPVVPLDRLPSFDERLRAIAFGLIRYQRFEPAIARFDDIARAVLAPAELGN